MKNKVPFGTFLAPLNSVPALLVGWSFLEGIGAAVEYIEAQIEAGAFDGGIARCRATTRKGKPCQRTPLPERDYCPSHQHLEQAATAAA